jgi:hypothetical protein
MPKLLYETIEFKAIVQDYKLDPSFLIYAIFFVRKILSRRACNLMPWLSQ